MSEVTVPDDDELIKIGPWLTTPGTMNMSTWSKRSQFVGGLGVERWTGSVRVPVIGTESDERQWRGFLFGLKGQENWFKFLLPCNLHAGSKPTVGGGAGDGYTLPVTGASNGTLLVAGQFITVPLPSGAYRAVCLTSDLVISGGSGTATFAPALGETPTGGVTVETLDPFIAMRAAGPTMGVEGDGGVSGFELAVEEYL